LDVEPGAGPIVVPQLARQHAVILNGSELAQMLVDQPC
jgi:hypothetical protein